jgi:tetratricopeptide (TPR) repeat protein
MVTRDPTKGHFTSHYLAEILRDVFHQERGGLLTLESSAGPKVSLRFDRGMLVDADTASGAATLAAALRDDGIVAADTLLDVVQDCATARELAEALLARRAVVPEGLATGVKGLIRRALTEAFSWQGGLYAFEEGRAPAGAFTPDVLFTFESILGGIAAMSNFPPLKEALVALPGRLKMSPNMFLPVHRLALKAHHGFVLSRIDGSMTMGELAQVVPADSVDEALKFAYGLMVFGAVLLEPGPGPGAFSLREIMSAHHETRARFQRETSLIRETLTGMAGQSAERILGVPEGADRETLKTAFEDRRAQFRRERFLESVREAMKRDLEMIEAKLTEAFFRLELQALEATQRAARESAGLQKVSEDEMVRRREFSKTEAQATQEQNIKLAEKYFQKAREYFREGDYYNCIQFSRLAIKFNGESAAAYQLMADALARNPDKRWQRQAEEAYVKATELDPFNAEFFVALGVFYRERGMDVRARKMFEKALEILPSHAVAAKELKGLRR